MLREILTFELGLNVSMTGFAAPPSTTNSFNFADGWQTLYERKKIYIWINLNNI